MMTWKWLGGVAGTCCAAGMLAACSQTARPVRVLSAGEFASSESPERAPLAPARVATSGRATSRGPLSISPPAREVPVVTEQEAGGDLPVDATPGAPVVQPPARRVEAPVLVDAKVGDINGKAVYASAFFEPLEAQLRAEARFRSRLEWRTEARRLIASQLNAMIEEELLRAEAVNLLPEQQREAGLRNMMEGLRRERLREARGSAAEANRRVLEESGLSLDQIIEREGDKELIRFLFFTRVRNRVQVSWREIQQEYERRFGEFNPSPKARFLWIRVPERREADVAKITEALKEKPFADVAAMPENAYRAEAAGIYERTFTGEFSEGEYFARAEVNEAARKLKEGEWVGPISADGNLHWIMLEKLTQVSMPLYEAQGLIERDRAEQLLTIERDNFVMRLRERASFTDAGEMVNRLLTIAEERYLPPIERTP